MKNKYFGLIAVAGFAASLVIVAPAFAQGMGNHFGEMRGRGMIPPGVFGTVSAINGNTLSVTQKTRPNSTSAAIVYSVNASAATIYKNNATSSIASVATGDTVMVQGTVTGTNVAATIIHDGIVGMMGRGGPGWKGDDFGHGSTSTPPVSPIQGNGQPVIGGKIASISGTTIVVSNASNVTYTVNASNAKIVQGVTTLTVANLAVGDNIIVQGTVNGTSVTASSVIDQGAFVTSTSTPVKGHGGGFGFLGSIGSFFKHIFGF